MVTANAIRDELEDAVAVLDAFHVVKLGLQAMEETRRRVQQEHLGHRGRKNDPLYRIRNALRAGAEKLTERQIDRIDAGLQAGDPTWEVTIAWQAYQRLRSAFASKDLRAGHKIAAQVLESFHTCPVPEITRLGRTLRSWSAQFLAYFTTGRANNGGTEAVNGIIELPPPHRPRLPQPEQLPASSPTRISDEPDVHAAGVPGRETAPARATDRARRGRDGGVAGDSTPRPAHGPAAAAAVLWTPEDDPLSAPRRAGGRLRASGPVDAR